MTSNKALISIIPEGIPVLENSLGIRWQPSYMDGRYVRYERLQSSFERER